MKLTITIDDTLPERVNRAIERVKAELLHYCKENKPNTCPDWQDLDYNGDLHAIIGGSVPTNTKEINDIFYLHGDDVERAFDDAGIGDKDDMDWPCGWKGAAIYCYIEQEVHAWWHAHAEEVFDAWKEEQSK